MTTAPTPVPHGHLSRVFLLALALLVAAATATAIVLAVRGTHTSSTSQLHGSGLAATSTRSVPAFNAVELAGANGVTVHVGGLRAVSVHGDANLLRYVTTTVRDATLVVGQSRGFETRARMDVEVTVPSLDAVTLSGAGSVVVDGVAADAFTVDAPGAGTLAVSGTAKTLDATLSGAGTLRLEGLVARDATATVSGAGTLRLTATRRLDATVSGVGSIVYGGSPARVSTSVSGTGSIAPG